MAVGGGLVGFGVLYLTIGLLDETWVDLVFVAVGLAVIGLAFEIRYVSGRIERPSEGSTPRLSPERRASQASVPHGERYRVERRVGVTRMLWRVRARIVDMQTYETMDVRRREDASDICEALGQNDEGELPPLPDDASPFTAYAVNEIRGWHYVSESHGALLGDYVGRTRSTQFAVRVSDALNRAHPRRLRPSTGRVDARGF